MAAKRAAPRVTFPSPEWREWVAPYAVRIEAQLDQHLPPLVERLVRAEIERVVGRAL